MTTFVNNDVASGDTIFASDHNEQGSRIASVLNGGIDNENIASDAAIATSKLADDAGITTAKIEDAAVTSAKIAAGAVTPEKITNSYKFSVYRSSAWTTTTGLSAMTFNASNFDTGSNYSTSTGKFTAPINGFYFFSATVDVGTVAAAHGCQIALYKNGASARYGFVGANGTNQNMKISVSGLLQLTAGDYVQVYVGADGNAGGTGADKTTFDGFIVSAA